MTCNCIAHSTRFQIVIVFPNILSHDHWSHLKAFYTVVTAWSFQLSQCSLTSWIVIFFWTTKRHFGTSCDFTELKYHRRKNSTLSKPLLTRKRWTLSVNNCFPLATEKRFTRREQKWVSFLTSRVLPLHAHHLFLFKKYLFGCTGP